METTRLRHIVLVLTLASVVPRLVSGEELRGRIATRAEEGGATATAVVYAEPLDSPAPARGGSFTVAQKNKTFVPHVLGVPMGATVSFPNEDPIFHNVFSLTAPQPFDLGLYRSGKSASRTFTQPAVYHVFCNIHPQMSAFLVIAPSPWVTTADSDGMWRLDVPPGRYRITAMSERATAVTVEVKVNGRATEAPVITLDESRFVQTQHLNKFGKPYPASAYKDR